MEIRLTSREIQILRKCLEDGKLRVTDVMLFYKGKQSVVATIDRFIMVGVAKRGLGDELEVDRARIRVLLEDYDG